ncbi:6-hydroxymethylpterin diphosphokinase MptE-like protein [Candidatus Neomarinimicrobiota bacterium]
MSFIEKLKHINRSDVDLERIYLGLGRRIKALPHNIAWNLNTGLARQHREQILAFKDKHKGERCVIIGNGPSLNKMDLSLLKNEITFGLNRIYLLFPRIDFQPTYYATMNEALITQFHPEISQLLMPKFITWNTRKYFMDSDHCHFIKLLYDPQFCKDLTRGFWSGATVTFMTMQIAYYMGFKEVILIGVDHRFKESGISGKLVEATGADPNHFAPNYFSDGAVWNLPDYKQSEWSFSMAKEVFESEGRRIMDATVDGNLAVFPKTDYESLF